MQEKFLKSRINQIIVKTVPIIFFHFVVSDSISFFANSIISFFFVLPAIITAMSVHEYAHAQVATWLGDHTARLQGRLSLDPRAHVDLYGLIALLFLGFGWAKPVPYQPDYFKHPRRDALLTALAGPLANLSIALISTFGFKYLSFNHEAIAHLWAGMILINIGFGIFNLLPIPPLDGSKILLFVFSPETYQKLAHYAYLLPIVFLGDLILDAFFGISFFRYILTPVIDYITLLFYHIT